MAALKKEVVALTIMKLNYEQIVSAHQSQPGQLSKQISDEVKFQVVRISWSLPHCGRFGGVRKLRDSECVFIRSLLLIGDRHRQ